MMSMTMKDIAFYTICGVILLPVSPIMLAILLLRGGSLNIDRDPSVYPEQPLQIGANRRRSIREY
jgi:hypothetical protein